MQKIGRTFVHLIIGILFCFLILPSVTLCAEEEERLFAYLDKDDEFLVYIEWENTQPIIQFKSPSGKLYNPYVEEEGTYSSVGGKTCYYYIEEAEKGRWNVILDKLDNENVSVTLESITSLFIVEDVEVTNVTGTSADVVFNVIYDTDRIINYQISISANDSSRGEVIANGRCNTNETYVTTLNLSKFSTYNQYRFYVYAWFEKDGVEIFDGAYSPTFSFDNIDQQEMNTPAWIEIRPEEMIVNVGWQPNYGYTYMVSIFENGAEEPSWYKEIEDMSVKSYNLSYGTEAKDVVVRMAEKTRYTSYSNSKLFEFNVDRLPEITFDSEMATNRGYIGLRYKGFQEGKKVEIAVNGEKKQLNLPSLQEGEIEIEIKEKINHITLTYYDEDNITVVYERNIMYNRIPPKIYMMCDYTGVTTSNQKYVLRGMVTGADSLFVAGDEIEFESNGSFSATIILTEGENIVTIEAIDSLGNRAEYTANINFVPVNGESNISNDSQENNSEKKSAIKRVITAWLPGIIAVAVALTMVVLAVVLPEKKTKDGIITRLKQVFIAIFSLNFVLEAYFAVKWYVIQKQNNSLYFLDKSYESLDVAVRLLESERTWKKMMTIGGVSLIIFLFIILILTIVFKIKKGELRQSIFNEGAKEENVMEKNNNDVQ